MIIYLYVKTHQKTGLKYLGQTRAIDPHEYSGSGVYWLSHLKVHGFDYTTEILHKCTSKEELKELGLYYSKLWNIVESNEWANLKEECGDGGRHSDEVRKRIGEAGKGRIPWNKGISMWSEDDKKRISENNKKRQPQSQEQISNRVSKNTGQKRLVETKKKMSIAQTGKTFSDETKQKMSKSAKGRIPWNKGISTEPTRSKKYIIKNIETDIIFEISNLKRWCQINELSYKAFWKANKECRVYKNFLIIEKWT